MSGLVRVTGSCASRLHSYRRNQRNRVDENRENYSTKTDILLVVTTIVPRRALATARRRASFSRVLVVNGPRQSGKSVLLRLLHDELGGSLTSFDDVPYLRVARNDPAGFLRESARPAFVDEVQRAGNPFILAVKAAVDQTDRPGQFVLAGSTRFLLEPRLS